MSRSQRFEPTVGWVDISDVDALTHIVKVALDRLEVVEDRLKQMAKHRDEWREEAKCWSKGNHSSHMPADRLGWETE